MFTPCSDAGSNQEPLDCKSEALPTELCGPSNVLFEDVYKLNDVSNEVILNKITNHQCSSNDMLTSATKQKQ